MARKKKEDGEVYVDEVMQAPDAEELQAPEQYEEALQPYDRVRLTFANGRTEECFYVSQGVYSKANTAGKPLKVGQPREGVVLVEKLF